MGNRALPYAVSSNYAARALVTLFSVWFFLSPDPIDEEGNCTPRAGIFASFSCCHECNQPC